MDNISIVPLENRHMAQIEKWPSRHAAANTLFKTSVEPDAQRQDHTGWAAVKGEEVLAIVTLRLNKEHVGYINCMVKSGNARMGVGTKIFEHALNQPEIKELVHLHAAVDSGNAGAQHVLRGHGFTLVGNDQQGYLEYAKHTHY